MKTKNVVLAATGLLAIALVAGCEWSAGGSASSWSDRYNWVNFNGLYRGVKGGLLVTDYTAEPGGSDITSRTARQVVATGDGVKDRYTGVAGNGNIVSGSFVVEAGSMYWYDNGSGTLTATGPGAVDGRITYSTGAWMIEGVVPAGVRIVIRFAYTVDSDQTDINRPGSGASRIQIFSFAVVQEGEKLTITDNNGSVYTGSFGSVATNAGTNRDNPISALQPTQGTQVIAQFNASGVSAAGRKVRMTGTFQGTVSVDAVTGAATVTERVILGTWIEQPGRTGDINGAAR